MLHGARRPGSRRRVNLDLKRFENEAHARGYRRVAGVDEAGRGPLAGPVVASAVILGDKIRLDGIYDSKQLTARKRLAAYQRICREALAIGIGVIDAEIIDRINILQSSLLAMEVAVAHLDPQADYLMIDGNHATALSLPQRTITKGDARSVSIAAASIVAKVTRDRLMERYHTQYPAYRFDRHKGYPTRVHREAVRKHGCCPIHRVTFRGVKEYALPPQSTPE
jgi:ribonuclease HII